MHTKSLKLGENATGLLQYYSLSADGNFKIATKQLGKLFPFLLVLKFAGDDAMSLSYFGEQLAEREKEKTLPNDYLSLFDSADKAAVFDLYTGAAQQRKAVSGIVERFSERQSILIRRQFFSLPILGAGGTVDSFLNVDDPLEDCPTLLKHLPDNPVAKGKTRIAFSELIDLQG